MRLNQQTRMSGRQAPRKWKDFFTPMLLLQENQTYDFCMTKRSFMLQCEETSTTGIQWCLSLLKDPNLWSPDESEADIVIAQPEGMLTMTSSVLFLDTCSPLATGPSNVTSHRGPAKRLRPKSKRFKNAASTSKNLKARSLSFRDP
jgi:hypothetical protein